MAKLGTFWQRIEFWLPPRLSTSSMSRLSFSGYISWVFFRTNALNLSKLGENGEI